jgi:hypothetical protein
LRRLAPFLLLTVAYLFVWQSAHRSPRLGDACRLRHDAVGLSADPAPGVGGTTSASSVAPLGLVADYPSYPVSLSLLERASLLALAGWLVVLALAFAVAARRAAITS